MSDAHANPHLDALRAIAALVVFAGHARELFIASPRTAVGLGVAAGGGTTPGHQAVMIFFVLSGYLVGSSVLRAMRDGTWSTPDYAARRLARLWTALLPALVLGWLIDQGGMALFGPDSIYGGPPGQTQVARNLALHLTLPVFAGNAAFLQGIVVPSLGTNVALWSLSYEFWFYVLFPLLAFAALPGTRIAIRVGAIAAFSVIAALTGWQITLYLLTWMMGAAVALLPATMLRSRASWMLPIAIVAFAALNVALLKLRLNLIASDFILAAGCAAMLWVVVRAGSVWRSRLYDRVTNFLAGMSFTLYLVHLPALVFLCGWLMRPWQRWPLDLPHGAIVAGAMALVFLYAWVCYLAFERHTPKVARAFRRLLNMRPLAAQSAE